MAIRLKAMKVVGYENGFEFNTVPSRLYEPLKKKKPTVYFVKLLTKRFHQLFIMRMRII